MSSENYEANGFGHNLDLLIISHWLHVSYPMRNGCREKSIWITHIYLIEVFYLMLVDLHWIFWRHIQWMNLVRILMTQEVLTVCMQICLCPDMGWGQTSLSCCNYILQKQTWWNSISILCSRRICMVRGELELLTASSQTLFMNISFCCYCRNVGWGVAG